MSQRINCFIPYGDETQTKETILNLKKDALVGKIYLLNAGEKGRCALEGCEVVDVPSLKNTEAMKKIAERADADFTLLYTKESKLEWVHFALERMVNIAEDSGAAMIYADHFNVIDGVRSFAPVIDYQMGSLRDDFDFGSVLLYRTSAFKEAVSRMNINYQFAALYDLRLKVSQKGVLEHMNEYLYYEVEMDTRKSGEKLFDYVDPKNRAVQIEMEQACTEHLKEIGGFLKPEFTHIEFSNDPFEY